MVPLRGFLFLRFCGRIKNVMISKRMVRYWEFTHHVIGGATPSLPLLRGSALASHQRVLSLPDPDEEKQ